MLKPAHSPSPTRAHLLASRAQSHRRCPTEPERKLWAELSGSKLGVAFRRQVILGNAIADFFAPSLRLVIEVLVLHEPPAPSRSSAKRSNVFADPLRTLPHARSHVLSRNTAPVGLR